MRSTTFWSGLLGLAASFVAAGAAQAADFVFPQSGPCTSSYYSQRSYGNHAALDIAGPNGTAIAAARAGTVASYSVAGGYGNLMIVTHESGYQTYYAHLSGRAVSAGTRVTAGQTIAYEGSTGNSTGPHVHFEVRRYGTKQYVPGSVGNRFTRGAGIAYDYPGVSDGGSQSGGGTSGGGSSSTVAGAVRVNASALNVRSGPGTSYGSLGLVSSGQVYVSSTVSNGWHKVWFAGREGWSSGSYLLRASGVTVHTVNVSGLNVRTGPGTGSSILRVAGRGERYARTGTSGDWVKVWYDGAERWLSGQYTTTQGY